MFITSASFAKKLIAARQHVRENTTNSVVEHMRYSPILVATFNKQDSIWVLFFHCQDRRTQRCNRTMAFPEGLSLSHPTDGKTKGRELSLDRQPRGQSHEVYE